MVLSLLCGFASVFYLIWPIYKAMGWLPSFPTCPTCENDIYYYLGFKEKAQVFSCTRCGQIIEFENETIAVKEKDNSTSTYLILRWPGLLGRWKKISIW